jgi:hypothetical protein
MRTKEIDIGATLCDCCEKIIYESEFNLINEEDIVCNDCQNIMTIKNERKECA